MRLRPPVDEVAGEQAAPEDQGKIPLDSTRRRERGALPHPDRQHRLDGRAQKEVEREKRPGRGREQGDRQDAEVISVLGEDEAVKGEKAENGAGQKNADRQNHGRPRDQHRHGDEHQDDRDIGQHGHVAHEGDDGVEPGRRRRESEVVPEITQTHHGQKGGVDEGKPVRPAEKPPSDAHLPLPGRHQALSEEPPTLRRPPARPPCEQSPAPPAQRSARS